jgi:hypothetical protein
MPVNSTHPTYKKFIESWTKCRDAVEGQSAIKAARTTYLPKLSGHYELTKGEQAYQSYLGRALWFGATDRTLRGYVGAIMRNDPAFDVPDVIKERLQDITDAKQTAVQFTNTVTKELLTTGRVGMLVDKADGDDLPFVKLYYPENILNWIVEDDDLVAVTLEERVYAAKEGDPYDLEEVVQIRELTLVNDVYTVTLYRRASAEIGADWLAVEQVQPTNRAQAIDKIPFIFVSADDDAMSCSKPPLLDLVDANINHYQLDADYRHGLHFTALPTAVFTGVDEDKTYYLGSEGAINLRNEQSKAFFLEFQGLGLSAIKDAMEERKAQMASLGAQLLQRGQRGRGVETAEAARIQNSGETSLLAAIVGRTEEALEQAFAIMATWAGVETEPEDVEVAINRDFIDAALNAEEINSLVGAWQTGAMPTNILFWNLQRGGVIDPTVTLDEYQAEMKKEQDEKDAKDASKAQQAFEMAQKTAIAKGPEELGAPGVDKPPQPPPTKAGAPPKPEDKEKK